MLRTFFSRRAQTSPLDMGQCWELSSSVISIPGRHRSGTSLLCHLFAYTRHVEDYGYPMWAEPEGTTVPANSVGSR
jgi:hypothetical protein